MNLRLLLLIAMVLVSAFSVADEVKRVSTTEVDAHLIDRVEPVVPAIAKTLKIGGDVVVGIDITPAGQVENIRVVSGHPMLVQSAIDAVRKWKFKPFLDDGIATRVTSNITIHFRSGMSASEAEAREHFFPIEDKCRSLVTNRDLKNAESTCKNAVELSDKLPPGAKLERSDARSLLGHAFYLQNKFLDAIRWYEDALKIDQEGRKADDADLGSSYANLGRAYGRVGRLAEADKLYAKCVETFEAAIKSLPDMKENYTRRLKRMETEYAALKDTEGQPEAATALRKKAASQ